MNASGPRGSVLALGLAVLTALVLWFAAIAPLRAWYDARADLLAQQEMLVRRMALVAATLPALRAAPPQSATPVPLEGGTDALASAALLGRMQDIARAAGANLASVETLTGEAISAAAPQPPAGYRRIGLRVAVAAPWEVLVTLLQALDEATPRMRVDDLRMRAVAEGAGGAAPSLDANFTILALRAGGPGVTGQ